MFDQVHFVLDHLPSLLIGFPGQRPGGLFLSLLLAVFAVGMGLLIALPVGLGYSARRRSIHWASRIYVEIFRGIPLIVLLLLVYQVVGGRRTGLDLGPRAAALIALTLYSSAYQAEILRAGLRSVPEALTESARLMGGSRWHVLRTVQLRYAVRVMLPAFTGQAISLFKDTSVVIIIGVAELMTVARIVLGADVTYAPYWITVYIAVGLLYFVVAFTLSRLANRWERSRPSS